MDAPEEVTIRYSVSYEPLGTIEPIIDEEQLAAEAARMQALLDHEILMESWHMLLDPYGRTRKQAAKDRAAVLEITRRWLIIMLRDEIARRGGR